MEKRAKKTVKRKLHGRYGMPLHVAKKALRPNQNFNWSLLHHSHKILYRQITIVPPALLFIRRKKQLSRKKRPAVTISFRLKTSAPFRLILRHQKLCLALSCMFLVASALTYQFFLKDLPPPTLLTSKQTPLTTQILDRKGHLLYRLYKDTNRINLSWEEIPDLVKNATIAIEDSNFYHHPGISLKSIARAVRYNLGKNEIIQYQGGSTITQQLVKNRLLSPEKSYSRKIKEIVLSLWTERLYSKKEILTMYLNEVGYGGTSYGIEAASHMYFGKGAKDLTIAQAAFLAGLPAAPTTFSPFGSNPNLSFERQMQVLERMRKLGMITQEEYEQAKNEKIAFIPQKTDIAAPHFVMYVKEQLINKLGEEKVTQGGLEIVTTLDLDVQRKAEEAVTKEMKNLKDRYNIHNAATLVTQPTTGEILAMVGSVDYFDTDNKGYVNATNSLRQPGSSIKPINYGYAFDHGYTPTSVIEDAAVAYKTPGSTEIYTPVNYDGKYHGNVTLRSALANSYNIPAVKLLNRVGVSNMIETGKAMGIKSWENIPPVGLSLTLGAAEVTMLDMARAYGTIANLGMGKELKIVREIHDSSGNNLSSLLEDKEKNISLAGQVMAIENKQVISPLSAWWLTDILSDNVARLPAFGPYAKLTVPNHKVAVKTGTSNNFRDNWTIGFNPDYLVATWVGNNDGSFMNKNLVSGITGAAPIWNETMASIIADQPPKDFPKPQGLIPVKICAVNGLLTCPNCPQEKTEYFTADKVPTKTCYFRSSAECEEAKKQSEGKSEEERKQLLANCVI